MDRLGPLVERAARVRAARRGLGAGGGDRLRARHRRAPARLRRRPLRGLSGEDVRGADRRRARRATWRRTWPPSATSSRRSVASTPRSPTTWSWGRRSWPGRASASRPRSTARRSSTPSSRSPSASCRTPARASTPRPGCLVGSRHTAESLWEAIGDPGLPARTRLGPPGVDTELFRAAGRASGGRAPGGAGGKRGGGGAGRRRRVRPATRGRPRTRFDSFAGRRAARASSWSAS